MNADKVVHVVGSDDEVSLVGGRCVLGFHLVEGADEGEPDVAADERSYFDLRPTAGVVVVEFIVRVGPSHLDVILIGMPRKKSCPFLSVSTVLDIASKR